MAHLFDHQGSGILINHLINRGHHTQLHQLFNDFTCLDRHLLSKCADRNKIRHFNFIRDFLGRHFKTVLIVARRSGFLLAATSAHKSVFCRIDIRQRHMALLAATTNGIFIQTRAFFAWRVVSINSWRLMQALRTCRFFFGVRRIGFGCFGLFGTRLSCFFGSLFSGLVCRSLRLDRGLSLLVFLFAAECGSLP